MENVMQNSEFYEPCPRSIYELESEMNLPNHLDVELEFE